MSITCIHLELEYQVTFARGTDESWPLIMTGYNTEAEVSVVSVTVRYEEGSLAAGVPEIWRGRRVRKDGTPGAQVAGRPNYLPFWESDPGLRAAITAQAEKFQRLALEAAQEKFRAEFGNLAASPVAPFSAGEQA